MVSEKSSEFERQQVGVGKAHDQAAAGLRQGASVNEISIAEMGVPVKIVVDGVVDAAAVFSAETDVERGDAIMLKKRGEVRAGAQGANAQVAALANFLALLGGFRLGDFVKLVALPGGELRFRIGDIARDLVGEFFERVRAFDTKIAAALESELM